MVKKSLPKKQTGGPASSAINRKPLPKKAPVVNIGTPTVRKSELPTPSRQTIKKIDNSLKPIVKRGKNSSVKTKPPKGRKF